ncbi:MAG: sterol desaturase family protein [Alphaproteobacteria bacterium]|nr:sterol desaturase family protein [Alphaproteobacteria bacterium]
MIGDALPTTSWTARLVAALLRPFTQFQFSWSLIWWPFVLLSLVVAVVAYAMARRGRLAGFRRRFLSRAIWGHASSRADYAYYVVNGVLYPLALAPLVLAGATVAAWMQAGLIRSLGPLGAPLLSAGWARVLYTIAFFVALDFGRFIVHSLMHDVPWLWPFHKVHHSAERLTPFTNFRMHPVEMFLLTVSANLFTGIVSGVVWYVSGGKVGVYTFFGLHVGLAAFNAIGNLRHWQVWVSFGPWLERWLVSPALHQIHHSTDPRHFGKNRGYAFAVWDRLWGSLYVPTGEEDLAFGLGDGSEGEWHSVAAMYLRPFREVWAMVGAARPARPLEPVPAGRKYPAGTG